MADTRIFSMFKREFGPVSFSLAEGVAEETLNDERLRADIIEYCCGTLTMEEFCDRFEGLLIAHAERIENPPPDVYKGENNGRD